ncbi:uncharacterized protein BXZ73DRAFT_91303 [Epithele typhae]|uniref:uncharacterized protein n=1 Tax=Epithele typhae TaxID=378194 RepID=UPI002007C26C|nr:uncharacterized protein BXZ73DRAFT_91303 [Epithele typhae]KAH9924311.1 hypothetical protein BXZ73DRAFT_91303 [Epithele typhae]
MTVDPKTSQLSPETVPLGTGLPTREELFVHYPAKFSWYQLKVFVNSGDLGLLKRDRALQRRYNAWAVGIKAEYGSIVNYLCTYRLLWGQPDTLTLLRSSLDPAPSANDAPVKPRRSSGELPHSPQMHPRTSSRTRPELYFIAMNDWPYSVPPEVEHSLIWTRLPIYPPSLPAPAASPLSARLHQDGLWGFTGNDSPPPSPSVMLSCLPALAEWGITEDKLIRTPRGTAEEEAEVRRYGEEIATFVKRRWVEREWETAWFVNPPRLQSVPGLAHIHVFARRKIPDEVAN